MSKDDESLEQTPTFRIRFTISNRNEDPDNSPDRENRESSSLTLDDRESQQLSRPSSRSSNVSDSPNQSRKKLFKLLQPQNHKSSLFVNLSDIGNNPGSLGQLTNKQSFISPDLDQPASPASPPSSSSPNQPLAAGVSFKQTVEVSNLDYSDTILLDCDATKSVCSEEDEDKSIKSVESGTMSQGCNFINTLMTVSRRRSASVTPTGQTSSLKVSDSTQSRRASSSSELAEPTTSTDASIDDKTSRPSVCPANDTMKPYDSRKSSEDDADEGRDYIDYSELQRTMQPLQIDVDCSPQRAQESQYYPAGNLCDDRPVSLDDIHQLDIDNLRLEDECRNLEEQVKYWEEKVDDLERKRCGDDAPRTLVEKVLKQRKKLREIELQIFKLNLESSEESLHSKKHLTNKSDLNAHHNLDYEPNESQLVDGFLTPQDGDEMDDDGFYTKIDEKGTPLAMVHLSSVSERHVAGKFGSHIKPGQENTADILDAIPPSGSLQYKQYLSKASAGTDSGDYSQLQMFDQRHPHHRHNLPHALRKQHLADQHHHQYQQQHQYNQAAHNHQSNQDDSIGSSCSTRSGHINLLDEHRHQHKPQGLSQHDGHYRSHLGNNHNNRNLHENQAHLSMSQQQQHHQHNKSNRNYNKDQDGVYLPYSSIKGTLSDDSNNFSLSQVGVSQKPPTNSHHQHNRKQPSPVRPSHFEDVFRPNHAIPQDSSSTASSSSPAN